MTSALIGELLPFAMAMAISPLFLILIVLILVSDGARSNGLGFVAGRLAGVALVVGGVFAVFTAIGGHHVAHRGPPSTGTSIGRMVIGLLLIILAVRMWRNRPKSGDEPPPSKLMKRVENITSARAFVLALVLSVLDPATLSLGFIAGLDLAQSGLPVASASLIGLAFIAVTTVTVTVPLAIYLVGGTAAEAKLAGTKTWMMANEKTVMMVLFLIIGTMMIGRGIRDLGLG